MTYLAAMCIGVAVSLIQPKQPHGFVATALLIIAVRLYVDYA